MAFCSLVVETMGKHRDRGAAGYKARYAAYLAEVKNCMEEMEAIKPGINAEARAFRERMDGNADGAPRVTRPPPVGGAVHVHSTASTNDVERVESHDIASTRARAGDADARGPARENPRARGGRRDRERRVDRGLEGFSEPTARARGRRGRSRWRRSLNT